MADVYFNKSHEYIRIEGESGVVGITDYAQKQLGDIVFVELPSKGQAFSAQEEAAVIESVKAASEIYSPISGEVDASNEALIETPALVNEDPEGSGWFFKIKIEDQSELSELMTQTQYEEFLEEID